MKPRRLSLGLKLISAKSAGKKGLRTSKTVLSSTSAPILESRSEILPSKDDEKAPEAPKTARSLTIPKAPQFQTEKRQKSHQRALPPASSDILMEKLDQETKKKREEMQKAQRLYAKLKQNGFHESKPPVQVMTKKITIPKTPQSHLEKKFGKKVPSNLRKSPERVVEKKEVKKVNGLTVPVPFHFKTDQRLAHNNSNNNMGNTLNSVNSTDRSSSVYVSAAELAQKFQQDTRNFPVVSSSSAINPCTSPRGLTVAHSPKLQTEIRSKSAQRARPLSREEVEELEMQEFSARPFKARSVDRRILYESRGEIGVPKVPTKPLTQPVEFDLQYEKKRAQHQHQPALDADQQAMQFASAFKARPVPVHLKEGPAPLPPKKEAKLTLPESPKLNGKDRASSAPARRQKPHHAVVEEEKRKEQQQQKQAQQPRGVTQPQEFQLLTSARGAHYQAMLEEKVAREREELQDYLAAQRKRSLCGPKLNFDAAPMVPPKPAVKEATVPVPFSLQSVAKHEEAQQRLKQHLEAQQHQTSAFKAKPLPKTTYHAATVVHHENNENHENRAHVVPKNIVLESDVRAQKRREFDESVALRAAQMEEEKRQAALRKQQEENRQLQQLRRKSTAEGGMMFKAAPVMKVDPFAPPAIALAEQRRNSSTAQQQQSLSSSIGSRSNSNTAKTTMAASPIASNPGEASLESGGSALLKRMGSVGGSLSGGARRVSISATPRTSIR